MATLGSVCRHPVLPATPKMTIRAAAELMREHHVGALIILENETDSARPIGIVTDRDLVVSVLALDLDPNVFLIDDLLGRPLVVARPDQEIHAGLKLMKDKGVRRLPLVDKAGKVTGIVTLDDLLGEVARDMTSLAEVVTQEIKAELVLRQSPPRPRKSPRADAKPGAKG